MFPTTDWALLIRARGAGTDGANGLVDVVNRYVPCMMRYLMHVKRMNLDAAQETIQEFLTDKVVNRKLLMHADQRRGRFRNLLLASLENFLISKSRKESLRAVVNRAISIDAVEVDAPSEEDPTRVIDQQWAETILSETLERTRGYLSGTNQMRVWDVFERRLVAPARERVPPTPYADLVREFGFSTPLQAARVLTTAKRAFDRMLREVLALYALPGADVQEELREFLAVFRIAQKTRPAARSNK